MRDGNCEKAKRNAVEGKKNQAGRKIILISRGCLHKYLLNTAKADGVR